MKSALLSVVMFYADSQNLAGSTAVFRFIKPPLRSQLTNQPEIAVARRIWPA